MAENETLITIVVPVYNVEDYIELCLKSISNQNYKNIECIIVDDCGNDNSMSIVNDFVLNYTGPIQFLIIKNSKNLGLSSARNEGILRASGSYIFFLDSDDEITNDCIEYMATKAISDNFDLVICSHQSDRRQINDQSSYDEWVLDDKSTLLLYKQNNNAWNRLIRTDIIRKYKLNFLPNIYHEDRLWSFILVFYVKSCFVSTKKTYLYNIRPNSIMTDDSKKIKRIKDSVLIVNVMDKFMFSNKALLNRLEAINYVNIERFGVCIVANEISYEFGKEVFLSVYKKLKLSEFINLERTNKIRGLSFLLPKKIGFLYCIFLYLIYYKQKVKANV